VVTAASCSSSPKMVVVRSLRVQVPQVILFGSLNMLSFSVESTKITNLEFRNARNYHNLYDL
jgi:hypothetical protein